MQSSIHEVHAMNDSVEPAKSSTQSAAQSAEEAQTERNARGRLLQEGLRLFLLQGFASVSTRQICVAAGVTQPSLYHHFGSKEGLYVAVIQEWFRSLHVAMTRAISVDDSFRARLHKLALVFWMGQAGEYQAMQHDAMLHLPRESRLALRDTIRESVVVPLIALMNEGMAAGELPVDANPFALMELYWAIVDGFTGLYHRGDPIPGPQQNIAAIDLFIAGVRAMPSEAFAAWPRLDHSTIFE